MRSSVFINSPFLKPICLCHSYLHSTHKTWFHIMWLADPQSSVILCCQNWTLAPWLAIATYTNHCPNPDRKSNYMFNFFIMVSYMASEYNNNRGGGTGPSDPATARPIFWLRWRRRPFACRLARILSAKIHARTNFTVRSTDVTDGDAETCEEAPPWHSWPACRLMWSTTLTGLRAPLLYAVPRVRLKSWWCRWTLIFMRGDMKWIRILACQGQRQ